MTGEMWAAVVGSGVLVMGGLIGWVITWLKSEANDADDKAAAASVKAHELETDFLSYKALVANDLRVVERAFLEYKLYVSDEFVKRGDQSPILSEIFRKIESLTAEVRNSGEQMQNRFEQRIREIEKNVSNKEDRARRSTDHIG